MKPEIYSQIKVKRDNKKENQRRNYERSSFITKKMEPAL